MSITKEELFSLLEDSTDMINRARLDGTMTYVSPACYRILGFTPEELLGTVAFQFFHPDDIAVVQAGMERLFAGAEVDTVTYRSKRKDGSYVWLESTGRLIRDANGNPVEIQGSTRDITERLGYQKELEQRFAALEDEVSKRKLIEANLISEEYFKNAIIGHSFHGIAALDKDLNFVEWNEALEKMTGKKKSEVVGRKWETLYPTYVDGPIYNVLQRVLKGESVEAKELRFASKDGFNNTFFTPLKNEKKEVIGVLSITQDITEEKKLKDELVQQQQFLQGVTDLSPNILFVFDCISGKITFANKELFRLTRLNPEHLAMSEDNLIASICHPEDVPLITEQFKTFRKLNNQQYAEFRFRTFDRQLKTRWLSCKAKVFQRNNKGEVWQIIANASDISAIKETKDQLRKSRDLLQEAQRSAQLGLWEWDITNDTVIWSDELFNIFGLESRPEKLDYTTFVDLVHPEDRQIVNHHVTESFKSKKNFTFEHRLIQPSGQVRHLLANGKVICDATGRVVQMVGTAFDITDLRGTEALLKKKEEFISIASHELKTPLTSAKAYIQLLRRRTEKSEDETLRNYIERTNEFIDKLNSLISDLLDISKIQAGKIMFNFSKVEFDSLVKKNIESLQATHDRHELVLTGSTGIKISCDQERVSQVISNLVNNAVKYSPDSNKVLVNIDAQENAVILSVKDFGIGIKKEHQSMIFDRFYRVDHDRAHFQGLGIGLFISKEIVLRHNGVIRVESEPGKGSKFEVVLPR